ncbi:MAG: ATP-binding protein [Aggregatilineales bacterium]
MADIQSLISQNRLLSEEVKRRVDQLAAINTVAASVSQSLDLNQTLQTALQAVLDITEAQAGGISLIDERAGEVVLRAQQGWIHDFVEENPMRIPLGQGLSGRVIATDSVIINNDLTDSEQLAVPRFHDEKFRSIAMAPMHARGKIIGILSIMSRKPGSFDDSSTDVLRGIADTVGVALENARLYEMVTENQRRLRAVLQSTADGIIATDQHGFINLVNAAAETMLGVKADHLLGASLDEAAVEPPLRDALSAVLSGSASREQAIQYVTESGRALSIMMSPVFVERQVEAVDGHSGWVIVLQDITHLREAEQARRQMIQAAAHDMRNPLGVALNSLGMLKRLLNAEDDTVAEVIDIAQSGISRIHDLVEDLLNLEQLQTGYGLNRETIDLGELVYEVTGPLRPLLEAKALQLDVSLPEQLSALYADRRWLSRAICNYLDNAIKYAPSGSTIQLCLLYEGSTLIIEVRDDGPGIPQHDQQRLFERFYRPHPDSGIPGAGLGLAIVRSVAEAHGGEVYLHSSPGRGSIFGMRLPLSVNAKPTA